jgi:hypothetical protein
MNLPEDVVGRLVHLAPYEFLTVSRGLNAAANAIIFARGKPSRTEV